VLSTECILFFSIALSVRTVPPPFNNPITSGNNSPAPGSFDAGESSTSSSKRLLTSVTAVGDLINQSKSSIKTACPLRLSDGELFWRWRSGAP
jgi:hypothetical protein